MPAIAGKVGPISLSLEPGLTVVLALTWRMMKAVPTPNTGAKGRLVLLLSRSSDHRQGVPLPCEGDSHQGPQLRT